MGNASDGTASHQIVIQRRCHRSCEAPLLALVEHVHVPCERALLDAVAGDCEAQVVVRREAVHLVEPQAGEEVGERGVRSKDYARVRYVCKGGNGMT